MMDQNSAVILCSHVANGGKPIFLAFRAEPENEADSGWQFLCNTVEDENWQEAKVWSISEVLSIEPSLDAYIEYPAGTNLMRTDSASEWRHA